MILTSVVSSTQLSKNNDCKMAILTRDYDQWHDLIEGFIYGFYNEPGESVDKCDFCNKVGLAYAAM